jgi:hypothetical protein
MSILPYTPGTIVTKQRDDGKIDAKLFPGRPNEGVPIIEGSGYQDLPAVRLSFVRYLRQGDSMDDVTIVWE